MSLPDEWTDADLAYLREAVDLADRCPPSRTAYSVGALIVADGRVIGRGWSRRTDPHEHAEEAALDDVTPNDRPLLGSATIYSSLEPCGRRASRPRTCADLILQHGIPRIVFAWTEPPLFVEATGADKLRDAGRAVIQIVSLASDARLPNRHLLDGPERDAK